MIYTWQESERLEDAQLRAVAPEVRAAVNDVVR
jgi:hypothetical protein